MSTVFPSTDYGNGAAEFFAPITRELSTWGDLLMLDVRLAGVADAAFRARTEREWVGVKKQLERLVGWGAQRDALRSCEAYEIGLDYCRDIFERASSRKRGAR